VEKREVERKKRKEVERRKKMFLSKRVTTSYLLQHCVGCMLEEEMGVVVVVEVFVMISSLLPSCVFDMRLFLLVLMSLLLLLLLLLLLFVMISLHRQRKEKEEEEEEKKEEVVRVKKVNNRLPSG
jgi:Ca2+/Na+ antiporter